MAENGTAASPELKVHNGDVKKHNGDVPESTHDEPFFSRSNPPRSLRDALRSVNGGRLVTPASSVTGSEEDYDDMARTPVAVIMDRRPQSRPRSGSNLKPETGAMDTASEISSLTDNTYDDLSPPRGAKVYTVAKDDKELRDILRRGMQRVKEPDSSSKRRGRFRDLVFTRKFSTFDRQNETAANSPFHGFFTLFWIGVGILLLKIGADNWRRLGSPLGTNDVMKSMFQRDVLIVLASDGVMCGATGVSWLIQLLIFNGYIDWDRSGWILQNLWQSIFVGVNVAWCQHRDWSWTHTVYLVLHTLVMLMKQHSYACYNGYLSTVYKRRQNLLKKLKQLENVETVSSPSKTEPSAAAISTSHLAQPPTENELRQRRRSIYTGADTYSHDLETIDAALKSGEPFDLEQIHVFEQVIKWEIDILTEELMGKATSMDRAYPNNLTMVNHYLYIVFPTLVYELEYPRSESINWFYVAEKAAGVVGIIFVMIMLSQTFIYPIVMKTNAMKEAGMPVLERLKHFPWILSDLIFPFVMEYLLTWYLIWESVLNLLAELTYFADRTFYDAWWNSVSWDQFARDWNRPVHNFLLRHVYHSSISVMSVNKHTATLITFFLSACVHELVMWCIFKKLRGYLLMLQMFQLPLVRLSRTKWLRGRQTLGNIFFWVGIFTGPSLLCSMYLML